ncbi:MAG: Ig-like domain-containing protein [Bdellovibrionaceae bacterium]|nr:hypothetical protein [Bdellovibrionales bacterium]MCB9253078.1 Ig-like domain-containing protein [Pseudobdellovibrionaceae bacterium]
MLRNLSLAFCLALVLGACGKDLGEKKNPLNRAPIWKANPLYLPIACIWKNYEFNLNLRTSDPDGDTLRFELPAPPFSDVSVTERGTIEFFPAEFLLGDYVFEIVAFDGALRTSTKAHLRVDECR